VPPLFTWVLPIVPVPPSVPPVTVKGELASEPFTSKMPCCTVHGRAPALKPVRVQVAAPILLNVSKPRYCAAGPIRLTSNDPMPEPPSCKRLLAPDAITSPLMIEVGPKVSVLPPLPAKEIAKVVPVIVPLLVTLPAAKVLMPVPAPPVPMPEMVPLLVTVAVLAMMPKPPAPPVPVPEMVPLLVTVAVLVARMPVPMPPVPEMVPTLVLVTVSPGAAPKSSKPIAPPDRNVELVQV
jgi:hypothetical protein